jgi:hypothetical protein
MEGMVRRIGDWGKVENEKVTLSAGEGEGKAHIC